MSARGAEGILRAQGKLPAEPKPIKAEPEPQSAPETQEKAPKAEKKSPRAEKVGEAVGEKIGQTVGSGLSFGNQAAGFILGLLVWGWIVRPYMTGGVAGVKTMLMAKFFNKKLDGTELT